MAAVLVLAEAPSAGACKPALREMLSDDGCIRLQRALLRLAAAWARDVAPAQTVWSVNDPDGADEVAALVGGDAHVMAGTSTADAMTAAFERHGGPLLMVGTDVPRLSPAHAAAGLLDLQEGGDVSFGPTMDGGWYLVALSDPRPELFELADEVWEGPVVMARTLEVAQRLKLEIGLLRMERRLVSGVDLAAYAVDPLTPHEVRVALEPGI